MKKFLVLATSALVFSALPALAADADNAAPPAAATDAAPAPKGDHPKGGMMDKADTNGDGEISKEEFMANSEKMFADFDKNSDGKITKAEVDAKREEFRKKMAELRAQRQKLKEDKAQ